MSGMVDNAESEVGQTTKAKADVSVDIVNGEFETTVEIEFADDLTTIEEQAVRNVLDEALGDAMSEGAMPYTGDYRPSDMSIDEIRDAAADIDLGFEDTE